MKISLATAALAVLVSGCAATSPPPASHSLPGAILSEDFESTPIGAIPAGFTKTGEIGVEQGVAHSGTHAL